MEKMLLAAAAVLALSASPLLAQPLSGPAVPVVGGAGGVSAGHPVGQTVFTPRGPAVTTGQAGSFGTTTLPGGAGTGVLLNNGNGTSTLTGPNGVPTTVPTPR